MPVDICWAPGTVPVYFCMHYQCNCTTSCLLPPIYRWRNNNHFWDTLCAKCFKPIIPGRVYLCGSIYTHFTDVRKLSPKEVKQGSQGGTKNSPPVRCAPSWCLLAVLLLLPPQCTTNSPPNTHRFTRLRKQPASKSPDSLTQDSGFVLYL